MDTVKGRLATDFGQGLLKASLVDVSELMSA